MREKIEEEEVKKKKWKREELGEATYIEDGRRRVEDQEIEEETKKCVVSPQERQRAQAQL